MLFYPMQTGAFKSILMCSFSIEIPHSDLSRGNIFMLCVFVWAFLLHHNITVTSSMFFFFPKFLLLINNSIYYFYYFRTHNPTIKFIKIPVSLCFPFVLVLGSMVIIISRMMTPFSEEPPAFCSMMRPNFINQCWEQKCWVMGKTPIVLY